MAVKEAPKWFLNLESAILGDLKLEFYKIVEGNKLGKEDLETVYDGHSPLIITAAKLGDSSAVRLLIEKGVDPGTRDKDGNSVFTIVARDGDDDLAIWLLSNHVTKIDLLQAYQLGLVCYRSDRNSEGGRGFHFNGQSKQSGTPMMCVR